jgi:hypothetical protein
MSLILNPIRENSLMEELYRKYFFPPLSAENVPHFFLEISGKT